MSGYGIDDWLEAQYELALQEIDDYERERRDDHMDCHCESDDGYGDCDVCGEPIDYCLGHGTV